MNPKEMRRALLMGRSGLAERHLLSKLSKDPDSLTEDYGQAAIAMGLPDVASDIFEHQLDLSRPLHISNLCFIHHRQTTKFVINRKHQVAYIPISKCANTSIKNFFETLLGNRALGNFIHSDGNFEVIQADSTEFLANFGDFFLFSIVRDPAARLTSYYANNICAGSLKKEFKGLTIAQGLPSEPNQDQIQEYFFEYRQIFMDFRHHTDRCSDHIPLLLRPKICMYDIRQMSQLEEDLSNIVGYNVALPRDMVGGEKATTTPKIAIDYGWYAEDSSLIDRCM